VSDHAASHDDDDDDDVDDVRRLSLSFLTIWALYEFVCMYRVRQ